MPSFLSAYGLRARLVNVLANAAVVLLLATAPAAAEITILALGDSLTAGYGLAEEDSFAFRLEADLRARGHDAKVINAGVSGDTTAGGRARVGWLLTSKPDVVLLELGANDGLRGLDPALTERNLAAIIETAQASGAEVLLTGMKAPPNLGVEYAAEFEPVFPRLAKRFGLEFQPFFLESVAARPEFNQPDGIHPNAAGVRLVVADLIPYMERVLKDLKTR